MRAITRMGCLTGKCLTLSFAIVASLSSALAGSASAQPTNERAVSATVSLDPASLSAGGSGKLRVKLHLVDDAHVNANQISDPNLIPTVFTPKAVTGVTWSQPEYPEPSKVTEWYSTDPLSVYQDEAVIVVPFTLDKKVAEGELAVGGVLQAQACDHEQCYPPRRIQLTAQLKIKNAEVGSTGGAITVAVMTQAKPKALGVGDTVPDFPFTDFEDKPHKFSEFKGKYVLLDFWATWCSPCLADIPHLKEFYSKYRSKGFEILGLDSETLGDDADDDPEFAKETHERAKGIVKTRGANWVHANSKTAVPVAVKLFVVESLPTKILVDPQGKIVARIKEGKELDELLMKLLGGN